MKVRQRTKMRNLATTYVRRKPDSSPTTPIYEGLHILAMYKRDDCRKQLAVFVDDHSNPAYCVGFVNVYQGYENAHWYDITTKGHVCGERMLSPKVAQRFPQDLMRRLAGIGLDASVNVYAVKF